MHEEVEPVIWRPVLFWAGTAAIVAGVLSHVPMFMHAAAMGYRMVGMPMDDVMLAGMFCIVAGVIAAFYGVLPSRSTGRGAPNADALHLELRALDEAQLTPNHWALIGTLTIAVVVDVMKPATLGFVLPGMIEEYSLDREVAVLFPLTALAGTAIGSLTWGLLADRFGRRATILLSALMFIGTAICGAMPTFAWNVTMCFLMGLSAGGLLPITFTLIAEIIPARQRGWVMVLVAGVGTAGGYLASSASAAMLEPLFSWRVLWLMGLPTGLILILLNRSIPESPRYLALHGHLAAARRILLHFGVVLRTAIEPDHETMHERTGTRANHALRDLLSRPFAGLTLGLGLGGLAWGLVNFGFILWLPANLRDLGLSGDLASAILAKGGLMSLPGALVVTWLYHVWSSKNTLILFIAGTTVALLGFAVLGTGLAQSTAVLTALVVVLLITSGGFIATLLPYSAEIYPLSVRASGAGLIAGASKLGGIMGAGVSISAVMPGLAASAVITVVPVAVSGVILSIKAIETRGRRLEEIHTGPPRRAAPVSLE